MELGAGLYTTGATGGDKGVDTINAAEIYKGGNPITIQDIAWVIPGEPKVSSITKMKVARDLNWVFDTPALGYVDTLPSSAFIVTIRSYLTGGANDTIIGTLTFGTGSKIGVWSATAGSDVAVVSEKMLGIEIPANVFSAEDLSITLPMSIS
jgi:hypothetical protein